MNFALDLSDKLSLYLYTYNKSFGGNYSPTKRYPLLRFRKCFRNIRTMGNRKSAIADCRDVMSLATRWFTLAFDLYPILNTKTWIVSSLING